MDKLVKNLEYLIGVLVFVVIVSTVVSIVIYMQVHKFELSTSPDEWSAFGSYFGGVLSPIIYFATLIAIIVTMLFQKQLLAAQNKQNTYEKICEHKRTLINVIEQQIRYHESLLERASNGALLLINEDLTAHKSIIEDNLRIKEKADIIIGKLQIALLGFSVEEFDSYEKMKASFTKIYLLTMDEDDEKVNSEDNRSS